MRVRFASPPRTAKTQEKQPLPPAHDEALGAIRDAAAAARARRPARPTRWRCRASSGASAASRCRCSKRNPRRKRRRAAPPPSRRRRWRRRRGPRGGPAGERAGGRGGHDPGLPRGELPGGPRRVPARPQRVRVPERGRGGRRQGPAQRPAGGRAGPDAPRAAAAEPGAPAANAPRQERRSGTRPWRARPAAVDAEVASASTPAADEPVSPLNAMERDILTVLDDRGGEILFSHLGTRYRQIHGKPLDYRALGFKTLKRLVERLPGVFLQPGADPRTLRRARCEEDSDEKPTAPDTVASPPPPARPHRSVPTPVLMGEIEADLGANLRPERPTPKRILQRDDAPIDESADSAVSGAGRTEALEIGGIYAGICSGLAPFGAFVELDRGGVGLLHPSKCRLAAAGAPVLPAKRDRLFVRVLRIRDDGKLDFSTLGLDPKTGAPTPDAGATTTTAPREVPAAARNAKPAVPSLRAVEREVLEVIDDCGGEILLPNFIKSYKRVHGKPLDYRALGFARLALLVERLPGVCLQPGASGEILRRANVAPPTASEDKPQRPAPAEARRGLARRRGGPRP